MAKETPKSYGSKPLGGGGPGKKPRRFVVRRKRDFKGKDDNKKKDSDPNKDKGKGKKNFKNVYTVLPTSSKNDIFV